MDREEIKKILPHREPFLFLDEIVEIVPGKSAFGCFTADERFDFFRGHFPGNPVLPGVIMIEASAQLGACAVLMLDEFKGKTAYFAGIEDFRFKRIVRPGEKLEIKVELLGLRKNYGKGKVIGSVGSEIAFEGVISFVIK